MILTFVVDVHESMGTPYPQPENSHQGHMPMRAVKKVAPIEWAKTAIEAILRERARRGQSDTVLLLSTEEGHQCVKSAYWDSRARFDEQLKLLRPLPGKPTSLNHAISTALALLNQSRVRDEVDRYGQGRAPWSLRSGAVILLTESESVTGNDGRAGGKAGGKLQLTCAPMPGAEFTREPYRWDQRIFVCMMQSPGTPVPNVGMANLLRTLADMTGGGFNHCQTINKLLEATAMVCKRLASQGGVVGFVPLNEGVEQTGKEAPHVLTRGLISMSHELTRTSSLWPIPDSFYLDREGVKLPPRDAHPILYYRRVADQMGDEAVVAIDELQRLNLVPADRYVVELWGQGLKMPPNARWPVYVMNSVKRPGKGEPFGYLENFPESVSGQVYLVLLPYNYPRLVPLLHQAVNKIGDSLPQKWRHDWTNYFHHVPHYYVPPMRKGLGKLGGQVPDLRPSQTVLQHISNTRKAALSEIDRLEAARRDHPAHAPPPSGTSTDPLLALPLDADLLPVYENMRQALFGPRSLTLAGLYAKGVQGSRAICPMNRQQVEDWTLLSEVGASLVPQNPIGNMGAFAEVLRQKQLLRDPNNPVRPEDETPEMLMQKYLEVDFGNPFGTQAGGGGGGAGGRKRPRQAVEVHDEVENEAAVLGPPMGTEEEGEGAQGLMMGVEEDGEAQGGGEGGREGDGRARKRVRLSELPPLPKKKLPLRRQKGHRSLPDMAHSGLSTPMMEPTFELPPRANHSHDLAAAQQAQPAVPAPVDEVPEEGELEDGVEEEDGEVGSMHSGSSSSMA